MNNEQSFNIKLNDKDSVTLKSICSKLGVSIDLVVSKALQELAAKLEYAGVIPAIKLENISKYMSYILRHNPGSINLSMDSDGWVDINEFIAKSTTEGKKITRQDILTVVEYDNKKRYAVNENKTKVRACYGHSLDYVNQYGIIAEALSKTASKGIPDILYHGTNANNIDSILATGIDKMLRNKVHLSETLSTAVNVGNRHCHGDDRCAVLVIDAQKMRQDGIEFTNSDSEVWLVDCVQSAYISKVLYYSKEEMKKFRSK